MFGSEILETAIGLAFVYVLLSLTCFVLTESITRLFNMRYARDNVETRHSSLLKPT